MNEAIDVGKRTGTHGRLPCRRDNAAISMTDQHVTVLGAVSVAGVASDAPGAPRHASVAGQVDGAVTVSAASASAASTCAPDPDLDEGSGVAVPTVDGDEPLPPPALRRIIPGDLTTLTPDMTVCWLAPHAQRSVLNRLGIEDSWIHFAASPDHAMLTRQTQDLTLIGTQGEKVTEIAGLEDLPVLEVRRVCGDLAEVRVFECLGARRRFEKRRAVGRAPVKHQLCYGAPTRHRRSRVRFL